MNYRIVMAAFGAAVAGVLALPGAGLKAERAPNLVPRAAFGGVSAGPTRDLAPAARGIAAYVPRVRGDVRDFGRIGAGKPVEIGLLMRVRNQAQLEKLVAAESDRRSPYYHRYLTPAQFQRAYSPDQRTYDRTLSLLVSHGFHITETFKNRSMIVATTNAATAERYFSTEIHSVYQEKRGVRYMNVRPATLPAELRDSVVSVAGLHSVVMMHFPIRFGDPNVIKHSAAYATVLHRVLAERAAARHGASHAPVERRSFPVARHPLAAPVLGTSTPKPGPDPTESPEDPDTDYLNYYGYGPPVFATGYDYPVEHGYGGKNHAAASVIDSDYADSDAKLEYSTFNIPRTGTLQAAGFRRCGDPNGGPTCDGLIGAGDSEGESTLDAMAILSLAPGADFYEYLAPTFDDLGILQAYELAVSDDYADAVNSSFGGCETDDPSFEYSAGYIAMEGAALGISFMASTGDTGAFNCGVYASNGVPQTEVDISVPSGALYFTAVGGTSYLQITPANTNDYDMEIPWMYGGGGKSVIEPIPAWQSALVAQSSAASEVSTSFRNTPDVAMVADPGTNPDGFFGGVAGGGLVIAHNGALTDSGGTSLASPMFVAMQTDINEAQNSRNGFVNPGLYAIAATSSTEYDFAFHDIAVGENAFYTAQTGYDLATGIGSPRGFELAGAPEYGTPGATAAPIPKPSATPTGVVSTPSPSPTPAPSITPHPSGTNFVVATIAGASCSAPNTSLDGSGNSSCFANPTGIQYVAAAGVANGEVGQTDATLFVNDFATGFLRGYDVTSKAVVTYNSTTWNNATRAKAGGNQSDLYGLSYESGAGVNGATFGGLYLVSAGDTSLVQITLPTTTTANTASTSTVKALSGGPAAVAFDTTTGATAGIVDSTDGVLHIAAFAAGIDDDTTGSSALDTKGNFGITFDSGATTPTYAVTDSGLNQIVTATDVPDMSTVTVFATGAPLDDPKEIVYVSGTSAYYVANCGGNNIIRVDASTAAMTVAAGDGSPKETDGKNTGAEFDCPFGITTDGTNLFVTDAGGETVREITKVI